MVKSNNSYKILGIACDEYGNPQISDEDIGKRYAELLIKSFVNYNMEMLIIQEEKNKKNEFFCGSQWLPESEQSWEQEIPCTRTTDRSAYVLRGRTARTCRPIVFPSAAGTGWCR